MPDMTDAFELRKAGDFVGEEKVYRQILAGAPDHATAAHYLGLNLAQTGRVDEALTWLGRSVELMPDNAGFHFNLGWFHESHGAIAAAMASYRQSTALDSRRADAWSNLANLLRRMGKLTEAERVCVEAAAKNPDSLSLMLALANIVLAAGRAAEAVEIYRRILGLQPNSPTAGSNLLLTMNYLDDLESSFLFDEHRRIAAALAAAATPTAADVPPPAPRRNGMVRLGYVSGDFRTHSVAYFIEPILHFHDKSAFEIFCYSDVGAPDATTERIRGMKLLWRDIHGKSDAEAAAMVGHDGIDILVDLAGYTGRRLGLFAARAAPVQVSYLGYPNTTGLPQMDFRITDASADPPGEDKFHTERLLRVDPCFLAYAPPAEAPSPRPRPEGRPFRFGCFNLHSKITPSTISLWARVLLDSPESGLVVKNKSVGDPVVGRRLLEAFQKHGVAPERITTIPHRPGLAEHLLEYHEVDLALDCFPYNGTTTTCEALWMGVPVLTMAGDRHRSRVGVSILGTLGLEWLVADSPRRFRKTAAELARNPRLMAELRRGLRPMVAASPLCAAAAFTRRLERTLMELFRDDGSAAAIARCQTPN